MTLKDLLNLAENNAGTALETQLQTLETAQADLKPVIDPILAALNADWTAANIANLLAGLPAEIVDILKAKLTPTPHAGDAT